MSEVKERQDGSSKYRQGYGKEIWSEILPKKKKKKKLGVV